MKYTNKNLTLCYLSGSIFPSRYANSVQVISQCNAFAKLGIKVYLFGKLSKNSKLSDVDKAYPIKSNIKLCLMKYQKITLLLNIFPYFFWVLRNLRLNFDVFYIRHINLFLMLCPFGVFRKSELILELHHPISKFKYKLICSLSILCKKIKIVYISESLRNIQRNIFEGSLNLEDLVAHDGCPHSISSFVFNKKKNSIGYVGGFYRGRGLDTMVKIAYQLPNHTFHLIGGTKEKILELYDNEVPKNIICYGYINNSSINEYYDKFDICMALYDSETSVPGGRNTSKYMSPLKIFEYMSMGKYIIASKLPVIEEILSDGVNACLVNPHDIKKIVNSIKRYDQKAFAISIMKCAFEDSKKYTWNNRAKILLS